MNKESNTYKYCVKREDTNNSTSSPIFLNSKVRKSKDSVLKNRLQTLILSKGMSEADFYNSLGISKQVWYALSWGIWEATKDWKIKIAQALDTDSIVIWEVEK